jgi:hypothetical protein
MLAEPEFYEPLGQWNSYVPAVMGDFKTPDLPKELFASTAPSLRYVEPCLPALLLCGLHDSDRAARLCSADERADLPPGY